MRCRTSFEASSKGSITELMDLSTLRFGGIELCPKPKLASAIIFRHVADALPNVIPAETDRPACGSHPSQGNVNVRVVLKCART